ncbi:hypothetical protein BDV93DRAFT_544993 [Ceratobasidium sp. AG-I]|nr:hypothetical protein BDV93DRAFT_544993 [Ceratobasidium sp. AG-I]
MHWNLALTVNQIIEPHLKSQVFARTGIILGTLGILDCEDIELSQTAIKFLAHCGSGQVRSRLTEERAIERLVDLVKTRPRLAYEAANTLKELFGHNELQTEILRTGLVSYLVRSIGKFNSEYDTTCICIVKNLSSDRGFWQGLIEAGLVAALASGPLSFNERANISTEQLVGVEDALDIMNEIILNKTARRHVVELNIIGQLSHLFRLPFRPKFLSVNPNRIHRVIFMFQALLRVVMSLCDYDEFLGHITNGEIRIAIKDAHTQRHNIAVPHGQVEETMNKVEACGKPCLFPECLKVLEVLQAMFPSTFKVNPGPGTSLDTRQPASAHSAVGKNPSHFSTAAQPYFSKNLTLY